MKLPKRIIDTNVILRFFLEDDEAQFLKAKSFMQDLELGRDEALITDIVFAEVVWVLQKVYEIPRPEISERFSKLINFKGIGMVFPKEIYTESLKLYSKHSMDIQDILLALFSGHANSTIITFDKSDFKKLQCNYKEP